MSSFAEALLRGLPPAVGMLALILINDWRLRRRRSERERDRIQHEQQMDQAKGSRLLY